MMRFQKYVVTLKDSGGLKGRRYHLVAHNRESAIHQVLSVERFAPPRSAIKSVVVVARRKHSKPRRSR